MSLSYRLSFRIYNADKTVYIPLLLGVRSASYARVVGDVGKCTIQASGTGLPDDPLALKGLVVTPLLSVYKKGRWVATATDSAFIIYNAEDGVDADGRRNYDIESYDYNIYLDRYLVAYRAGSSESKKTGFADDVMKEIVLENLGSGAGIDYDGNAIATRSIGDLTIRSDTGAGASITTQDMSFEKVLDVLQDIEATTAFSGSECFFVMEPSESLAPRFRTAVGQLGQNLTDKLYFSPDRGNMKSAGFRVEHSNEVTVAYVLEHGNAQSRRITTVVSSASLVGDTTRRETSVSSGAVEAEGTTFAAQASTVGRSALGRKRAVKKVTGSIFPTAITPYLISVDGVSSWGLGDTVRARAVRGQTPVTALVRAIQVNMNHDGRASIDARIEIIGAGV